MLRTVLAGLVCVALAGCAKVETPDEVFKRELGPTIAGLKGKNLLGTPIEEVKYDIKKTDSLIRPFTAALVVRTSDKPSDYAPATIFFYGVEFAFEEQKWKVADQWMTIEGRDDQGPSPCPGLCEYLKLPIR